MAVRQDASALPPADLALLRQAFSAVLGLQDERGYQYYAGLHGLPLPVHCQHGTDLFLPWHRAYLYLFERALQDRVPGVALPWWDWTSDTSHRSGLPSAYAPARLPGGEPNVLQSSPVLLPSADVRMLRERLPGVLTNGRPPRTQRDPDVPDELPRRRTVLSLLRAPTFLDFSNRMESVHNDVHGWVGGSMSAVPVAAFDPVFWAHHSMIDRLWYLWQLRHPGADPPTELLDRPLTPFPLTVRQTLSLRRLGYDYSVRTV
jgi:tyrosinase